MTASRIGFAFCGSFCTLGEALSRMEALAKEGRDIYPIMSEMVYNTDTRFGRAEDFIRRTESACGRPATSQTQALYQKPPRKATPKRILSAI